MQQHYQLLVNVTLWVQRETGFTSSLPGYRNFASSKIEKEYATLVNVRVEDVPTKKGLLSSNN